MSGVLAGDAGIILKAGLSSPGRSRPNDPQDHLEVAGRDLGESLQGRRIEWQAGAQRFRRLSLPRIGDASRQAVFTAGGARREIARRTPTDQREATRVHLGPRQRVIDDEADDEFFG